MSTPLVTVVMSVHNGATTLQSAIHSLIWQTFFDWELLIVNDASTDSTAEILRGFRDTRIHVLIENRQKGLAARLNQCVDQARGKYIARMDADDIAYPERFERQVQYLDSHPEIDLLGHGVVLFKGEGEIIGLYPIAESHEDICRHPWWGFPLAHPTWMGRRTWFNRNRYDDTLTKGQDQELLLRSYRVSRFAALSDVLLGYRIDGISARKSGRGRVNYCRRLVRQVGDVSSAVTAVRGIVIHGLAWGRDVLLDVTRNIGRGSRQSFQAANDDVRSKWLQVWIALLAEMPSTAHPFFGQIPIDRGA